MVDVIYEDNHILVCIKPQNVPTQEDISKDKDMLTMVKEYIKEKYDKKGNVYVGLVHRLDRPTGGVMVFAKTSKSASRLCEQIKIKDFSKKYFAVVYGKPRIKSDFLVNYLKKDERRNKVQVVPKKAKDAKKAELLYNVIKTKNNLSLIDVNLYTGRSHQIRVQLANIQNPIYGDNKYGSGINKGKNLALWAYHLSFIHPTTKQELSFTACPPTKDLPWEYFAEDIKKICK